MRFVWLAFVFAILPSLAHGQSQDVIVGDYLEDRSNHVHGCYCEWSGESITGGREAVLGWYIRSGQYRGVDLSGIKLAVVVRGEMTLSIGLPSRQSVLILDEAATPEQRRAAESLIRDKYGFFLGQVVNTRIVPIEFSREDSRALMRVPGLLTLEMRKAQLPDDALPGAIKWFDPFVPLTRHELGTTTTIRYSGKEFGMVWSRTVPATTGYYGTFALYQR